MTQLKLHLLRNRLRRIAKQIGRLATYNLSERARAGQEKRDVNNALLKRNDTQIARLENRANEINGYLA